MQPKDWMFHQSGHLGFLLKAHRRKLILSRQMRLSDSVSRE